MSKDLRELIGRYLDGLASPEELADLDRRLQSDSQAARRFAVAAVVDAQLADHFRQQADVPPILLLLAEAESNRSAPRLACATPGRWVRVRHWAIAVGVSLLIVALGTVGYRQLIAPVGVEKQFSRVDSGAVLIDGSPAHRIPAGATFQVRGTTEAVVHLSDGSQATLAPATVVTLHGPSGRLRQLVELSAGGGIFRVAKAPGKFEVRTPAGRVTVLGTEFSIRLIPENEALKGPSMKTMHALLAVAVVSGIVQVESGGKTYRLTGGEERLFAAEASEAVDPKQRADELVAVAKACIEKAKPLVGEESKELRHKQYTAAAEAYAKALEIYPGWQIDDAAGKDPWARVRARQTRAALWLRMRRFDKAREEYRASFDYPTRDMLELRSWIHTLLGDSYAAEEKWSEAELAYQKAVDTGLYGDRRYDVPPKLEKARRMAEEQLRGRPDAKEGRPAGKAAEK